MHTGGYAMEPQKAPEVTDDPLMALNKMEDITIGMPVEAKDSYGKWCVCVLSIVSVHACTCVQ